MATVLSMATYIDTILASNLLSLSQREKSLSSSGCDLGLTLREEVSLAVNGSFLALSSLTISFRTSEMRAQDPMSESWSFITDGEQFPVQNLDQLYVLVSSSCKTCTVLESDVKTHIINNSNLNHEPIFSIISVQPLI